MASPSRPFNSWDALKILALLLMFVDHAGAYFLVHDVWLRAIGRGAAPIFLFLAGRASSYRFSREIFVLACLMTLSNIAMGDYFHPLNILFTILLWRAVLDWMKKRGKIIEKPLEWFIGATIFILPSYFLFQYGTLGLLFAIGGIMQRYPELYSRKTQRLFMVASFVAYAATFTLFFGFTVFDILLMAAVLCLDYLLLTRFEIRTMDMRHCPEWLVKLLTLCARYTGYIYAIHLIIISWISHYPI